MPNNDSRLKSELLAYLSPLPKELNAEGSRAAGRVAVQIGNFLLWNQKAIAGDEPQSEVPIDQAAQTIHALGKQFRQVGLDLWNRPGDEKINQRLDRIEMMIQNLFTLSRGQP